MVTRTQPARWPVRVRPAPVYDPPFDEELPPDWSAPDAVQPLLELPGLPGLPGAGRRLPPRRPTRAGSPDPTPLGASPATTAAAARFVTICLEILNGYRPVTHVRGLAAPPAGVVVLEEMTRAVRRLRPVAGRDGLVKLRAMRTCEPRPGVAEIALVIAVGRGTRADAGRGAAPDRGGPAARAWGLAYRLERRHGRWQCTAARLL